jgi:hydrogenase expression/formation protein HypC
MCLSVPGKVLTIETDEPFARRARIDFGGVVREANLSLLPEAGIGDWVLVHAGIGISMIDEAAAADTFAYLREIGEITP